MHTNCETLSKYSNDTALKKLARYTKTLYIAILTLLPQFFFFHQHKGVFVVQRLNS